jgi:hypothetical protein
MMLRSGLRLVAERAEGGYVCPIEPDAVPIAL